MLPVIYDGTLVQISFIDLSESSERERRESSGERERERESSERENQVRERERDVGRVVTMMMRTMMNPVEAAMSTAANMTRSRTLFSEMSF